MLASGRQASARYGAKPVSRSLHRQNGAALSRTSVGRRQDGDQCELSAQQWNQCNSLRAEQPAEGAEAASPRKESSAVNARLARESLCGRPRPCGAPPTESIDITAYLANRDR